MSYSRVHDALAEIAADLRQHLKDDAYLIGSAAACLLGADVEVSDLDLLTTVEDAVRLEAIWADRRIESYAPADDQLFRSRFSRYAFKAMPIEVMGDLQVCVDGDWRSIHLSEATHLPGHSSHLCLPTVGEQLRVLELFGRPKDQKRAMLLRQLA